MPAIPYVSARPHPADPTVLAHTWRLYRTAWKQAGRVLNRALIPPFVIFAFIGAMLAKVGDLHRFQTAITAMPLAEQVGLATFLGSVSALALIRPLRTTLLHPSLDWWVRQPLSPTTLSVGWSLLLHPASAVVLVLGLGWPGPLPLVRALAWSVAWLPFGAAVSLRQPTLPTTVALLAWPLAVVLDLTLHPAAALVVGLAACGVLGPLWLQARQAAAGAARAALVRPRPRSPLAALVFLHLKQLAHKGLARTLAVPLAAIPGAMLLRGLVHHNTLDTDGLTITTMVLLGVAAFPSVAVGARIANHHGARLLRPEWPLRLPVQVLAVGLACTLPAVPGMVLTLAVVGPGLPPPEVWLQPLLLAGATTGVVLRSPKSLHQPVNAGTWLLWVGLQHALSFVFSIPGALVALTLTAVVLRAKVRAWRQFAQLGVLA